jgi:hypothetical protein
LDDWWRAEFKRLRFYEPTDGRMLSEQEAWDRVAETPQGRECVRLEDLRDTEYWKARMRMHSAIYAVQDRGLLEGRLDPEYDHDEWMHLVGY